MNASHFNRPNLRDNISKNSGMDLARKRQRLSGNFHSVISSATLEMAHAVSACMRIINHITDLFEFVAPSITKFH